MKFNLKNLLMIIAIILCIPTFASCSDDDDKDAGSSCSGYFTAEGKNTKFGYGYIYYLKDGGVHIEMCDIDMLYYHQNPSKLSPATKMSYAIIDIDDDSKNVSDNAFVDYELEVGLGIPVLIDDDDENEYELYAIWGKSNVDPIKYERDGDSFTIEGTNIRLALPNNNGGWSNMKPFEYIKANFGFSGVPYDITDWDDDYDDGYYSSRSNIKFKVVTDPDEIEYLRKFHSRIGIQR